MKYIRRRRKGRFGFHLSHAHEVDFALRQGAMCEWSKKVDKMVQVGGIVE